MEIKMKMVVDTTDESAVAAMAAFFNTLNGQTVKAPVQKPTRKTKGEIAAEKAKAAEEVSAEKAEILKAEAEAAAGKQKTDEANTAEKTLETKDETSEFTLPQVRAAVKALTMKKPETQDELKAKVTSYGANNIAAIPKENYPDFMALIKKLEG